jgi:hypothetical protein
VKALPPIVAILVVTRQMEVGFKVAVTRFRKMIHLTADPYVWCAKPDKTARARGLGSVPEEGNMRQHEEG